MLSNLDPLSLHRLNTLRKLRYDINGSQLSEIHQQLRTVSSSLISEVNFTFHYSYLDDFEGYNHWGAIDCLMIEKFSALLIVTIEWIPVVAKKSTWANYVSRSVNTLPKLHQKGILRPVPPPPHYLE